MEFVDGLWQAVPINKPRRYNDAYLNEPAATNSILNSSTRSALWTVPSTCTRTTPSGTNPKGDSTEELLTVNGTYAGSPVAILQNNAKAASSIQYTISAVVKKGSSDWVLLQADDDVNLAGAWFNLNTKTVGGTRISGTGFSLQSKTIQDDASGYVKIAITITTNTALFVISRLVIVDSDATLATTIGNSIYMWNVQRELGSVATSPIITAGAAVTRLADVPSAVTINPLLNDWTLFFDLGDCATSSLFNYPIQVKADLNGSGATKINIGGSSTGLNYIIYNEADAEIMNSTLTQLGRKKFAIKKEGTTLKLFVNGALVYTKLSSAIGVVKSLILTTSLHTIRYNTFKSYPSAESDAACIAETTL
jgi:hypothetical protein